MLTIQSVIDNNMNAPKSHPQFVRFRDDATPFPNFFLFLSFLGARYFHKKTKSFDFSLEVKFEFYVFTCIF